MKRFLTILLSAILACSMCACKQTQSIGGSDEETDIVIVEENDLSKETEITVYTEENLSDLQDTQYFLKSAIEHIFLGQINKKGEATGYHYDGIENSPGRILDGTKSQPDANEVYTGKVEVDGVKKSGNGGYSSFYPEAMSPQEVVNAINEAYESKEHLRSNVYRGDTSYGFVIEMYLTNDDKIISAFPIYED